MIFYKKLIKTLILTDKIVALPTDTVFALIANAESEKAVKNLYKLKTRDENKPFAIFVNSFSMLNKIAHSNRDAEILLQNFCALTVILRKKETSPLAKNLNKINDTIAIRIPNNNFIIELISEVGIPLAATSINQSGEKELNNKREIERVFKDKIDFILDEHQEVKKPSTIIDLSNKKYRILRTGDVSKKQIEDVLGCKIT